ncbi:MAG: hypothetical protein JNM63_04205, partial [Spirochaetia bacterium]|nr:hypothetical protein [Spirochaetia bacterium]
MATRDRWGIDRNPFFHGVAGNLRFRILEHGYGKVGDWWPARQNGFPFNRLHLFFSGGGKVRDEAGVHVFQRGMVLLNPTHSDYEQIWDKPFETFYIHFSLEIYPTQDVFEGMKSARSYCLSGTGA